MAHARGQRTRAVARSAGSRSLPTGLAVLFDEYFEVGERDQSATTNSDGRQGAAVDELPKSAIAHSDALRGVVVSEEEYLREVTSTSGSHALFPYGGLPDRSMPIVLPRGGGWAMGGRFDVEGNVGGRGPSGSHAVIERMGRISRFGGDGRRQSLTRASGRFCG